MSPKTVHVRVEESETVSKSGLLLSSQPSAIMQQESVVRLSLICEPETTPPPRGPKPFLGF